MTHGSLMRDIPRLEPDDEFVDRLAELAAASTPTRGGVVVPVAFRGPAARSVAAAAAVAAIAAGGAIAATQLGHPHDNDPVPPISSVGTSGADDDHGPRQDRTARGADASETTAEEAQPQGDDSTAPDPSSSSNQAVVPTEGDHGSPGSDDSPGDHHGSGGPSNGPSDDPSTDDHGGHGGPGNGSGEDETSDDSGGGGTNDGSGGKGTDTSGDTGSDSGSGSDSSADGSGD